MGYHGIYHDIPIYLAQSIRDCATNHQPTTIPKETKTHFDLLLEAPSKHVVARPVLSQWFKISLNFDKLSGKSLQNGPKDYQRKFKKKATARSCSDSAETPTFNHFQPQSCQKKTKKKKCQLQGRCSMPVLQTHWLGGWSLLSGAPWHLFLHPKPPEAPNSSAPWPGWALDASIQWFFADFWNRRFNETKV